MLELHYHLASPSFWSRDPNPRHSVLEQGLEYRFCECDIADSKSSCCDLGTLVCTPVCSSWQLDNFDNDIFSFKCSFHFSGCRICPHDKPIAWISHFIVYIVHSEFIYHVVIFTMLSLLNVKYLTISKFCLFSVFARLCILVQCITVFGLKSFNEKYLCVHNEKYMSFHILSESALWRFIFCPICLNVSFQAV